MKYQIEGFEMIETGLLEPHPDALAYPSDKDDREIVHASTADVGTLQPLVVMRRETGEGFLVLDGCGRLEAGLDQHISELPCLVVTCSDPRGLAMNINSAGRKRSTGSRVLCYLMANRDLVMQAAEAADYASGRGVSHDTPPLKKCKGDASGGGVSHDTPPLKKGKGDIPADLKAWTGVAIAERLGVSNKDVYMALELLTCHDHGYYPSSGTYGKYAPRTLIAEEPELDALDKAFNGVISGKTPVRRWAAAFAGRSNTVDQAKAPTNWGELMCRSAGTLLNCIQHAPEIRWDTPGQQARARDSFAAVLFDLPETQRHDLIDIIATRWTDGEKAALAKRIAPKK